MTPVTVSIDKITPSTVTESGGTISGTTTDNAFSIAFTTVPADAELSVTCDGATLTPQGDAYLVPVSGQSLTVTATADGYNTAVKTYTLNVSQETPAADNVAGFFTMSSANSNIYFRNIVDVPADPDEGVNHHYTADASGSVLSGDKTITIKILKSAFADKSITEYATFTATPSGPADFVTFTEGADSYTGTFTLNEGSLSAAFYVLNFGYTITSTEEAVGIEINLKGITVDG